MTCNVCGESYPCAHSGRTAAVLLEPQIPAELEPVATSVAEAQSRADQRYWRQEVISRVQQHRARRRRRVDASLSLELDFPTEAAPEIAPIVSESRAAVAPRTDVAAAPAPEQFLRTAKPIAPPKIIHFPRHSRSETRLAVEDLELAEPVRETPRILDIPEDAPQAMQMELLPSFADIRLDDREADEEADAQTPAGRPLGNRVTADLQGVSREFLARAGLDLPPQPAGLKTRFLAGLLDAAILLAAGGLFGAIFSKLAGNTPASRTTLLCALATAGALWVLFQYLFLVYGRGTPGMNATGLELYNFESRPAEVNARRWRAMATALSGLSLGLGFAWALVDEDTLGWHDRISETYLKRSN